MDIDESSPVGKNALSAARDIAPIWHAISAAAARRQTRVLLAFKECRVSTEHFAPSTGYGYGDRGREVLEAVWSKVFGAEAALVRPQIVSGTHAIALCLWATAHPGTTVVSATGEPYETVKSILGIAGQENGLSQAGVKYVQVNLTPDNKPDLRLLEEAITRETSVVLIQRSGGYSPRKALPLGEIGRIVEKAKNRNPRAVCIVDNCYGEFVNDMEPNAVGADLVAGSLIKNPGGALVPTGGYVAGRADLVRRVAERLIAPGCADVGPSPMGFRHVFQGLFTAPHTVGEALKGAVFGARLFELLGLEVRPRFDEERSDIIQAIKLGSKEKLLKFVREVQRFSPVDSHVTPEPWQMPGYQHEVVMAAGTFVQGSSIELSADAPVISPYEVYLQGGISAAHVVAALLRAALTLFA
ncbi:MAG TPA: hypothetical protein GXX40_04640 [Firmicutes bacterium]|nr:hypothetical protein [Bacillota bacterium]